MRCYIARWQRFEEPEQLGSDAIATVADKVLDLGDNSRHRLRQLMIIGSCCNGRGEVCKRVAFLRWIVVIQESKVMVEL